MPYFPMFVNLENKNVFVQHILATMFSLWLTPSILLTICKTVITSSAQNASSICGLTTNFSKKLTKINNGLLLNLKNSTKKASTFSRR